MTEEILERFSNFVKDEGPAVDELREFLGGDLGPALDGSLESLDLLDGFIVNLTSDSEWASTALFIDGPSNPKKWLTVRVAYYLARCLRNRYGCEWSLSADADSPAYNTPVLDVAGIELSPLEISSALLNGEVEGGLKGLVYDLDSELQGN